MLEYVEDNAPIAYVELGLKFDDFIDLTFADYQDMIIYNNYQKTVRNEELRQIVMNAILVVESNKYSKGNKFKDIAMFKEDLEMFDRTLNEYEDIPQVSAKEARKALLEKFI